MSNEYAAIPRHFNSAVQSAKQYKAESLNLTSGNYINNGWGRYSSDGLGNSTTYIDSNHDHWVDEIQEKKFGMQTVVAKNTNPNKDNSFDLYKEYDKGELKKVVQDTDLNGEYDLVELYENGKLYQTIQDKNNDKEPDLYTFYDRNGEIIEQIDTRSGWEKFLDFIKSL